MNESNAATTVLEDAEEVRARPFVKWAGGKQQLLTQLVKLVPKTYQRYWEPFVGGGALFFRLSPEKATLVDANADLINAYKVVQSDVVELIAELEKYRYDEATFYQIRDWDRHSDFLNRSPVERAARFLYLNRTCFNGLYRVNSKGEFNVPFGRYTNPTIVNRDNLLQCSKVLKDTEIYTGDFDSSEKKVERGDFVYFDPPYVPLTNTSSFTSYTTDGFTIDMQTALRDLCVRLDERGVHWIVSNSSSFIIRELYNGFKISTVLAQRAINSKGAKRGAIEEVLVRNF